MSTPPVIAEAIRALESERRPLAARLDAIDLALSNLRAAYPVPEAPTRKLRAVVRRGPDRRAAEKPSRAASQSPASVGRSDAILKALRMNGGVGTSRELRAAMPKESGLTSEQIDAAYRNTMTRLKAKGLIDRTGDTWSLTGAGNEKSA